MQVYTSVFSCFKVMKYFLYLLTKKNCKNTFLCTSLPCVQLQSTRYEFYKPQGTSANKKLLHLSSDFLCNINTFFEQVTWESEASIVRRDTSSGSKNVSQLFDETLQSVKASIDDLGQKIGVSIKCEKFNKF